MEIKKWLSSTNGLILRIVILLAIIIYFVYTLVHATSLSVVGISMLIIAVASVFLFRPFYSVQSKKSKRITTTSLVVIMIIVFIILGLLFMAFSALGHGLSGN